MTCPLVELPEDLLLLLFEYLQVPEILSLRQTCQRLRHISLLRIVWINASKSLLLSCPENGDLEHRVRRSFHVAFKWLSGDLAASCKLNEIEFMATLSTSITDIRFIRHRWVLTVSNAIWSVLTIWDWTTRGTKCSEWSPPGAVFSGPLTLNTQPDSHACIAILTNQLKGPPNVVLFSLDESGKLDVIRSIPTKMRPMALHGTLLALCDETSRTTIHDFARESSICLDSPTSHLVDHAIDVIFTSTHILVVRARSVHLFSYPSAELVATHTFGWVDGASVAHEPRTNVFSILVRHQSDNPWTAELSTLQLYRISPSMGSGGYDFPPVRVMEIRSPRGALRCPDVALGRHGTAVWISPQERTLIVDDAGDMLSKEALVGAAFPGPLNDSSVVKTMKIYTNSFNNWTAFDYDESRGLVALGSSFGKVTILQI